MSGLYCRRNLLSLAVPNFLVLVSTFNQSIKSEQKEEQFTASFCMKSFSNRGYREPSCPRADCWILDGIFTCAVTPFFFTFHRVISHNYWLIMALSQEKNWRSLTDCQKWNTECFRCKHSKNCKKKYKCLQQLLVQRKKWLFEGEIVCLHARTFARELPPGDSLE